jgi:unsaturated rhamnogalacturonyl hydrolase
MKKNILFFLILFPGTHGYAEAQEGIFSKSNIKSMIDKVNDYQFSHPWTADDDNWIRGTYYTGVMACYQATKDGKYLQQCDSWGEKHKWGIPSVLPDDEESGANLLTCSQTWLESYMADKNEFKIQPLIEHLQNENIKNPAARPLTYYHEGGLRYVDALFVCPPAFAMLYRVTKDPKYLSWMDSFFWDVYGALYDDNDNLFYRDIRFRQEYSCSERDALRTDNGNVGDSGTCFCYKTTKNGKKVIWSRGNGWAFAGIARILKYTPKDYGNYNKYLAVYLAMANELRKRQQVNGFWYPNLDDPDDYGTKESSGTGFFTYGIAWGINNGLLNREEFLPVIEKSWSALVSAVSKEGKVQWGQLVGAGPYKVLQEDSHEYVTGTFLLAASEMYTLEK